MYSMTILRHGSHWAIRMVSSSVFYDVHIMVVFVRLEMLLLQLV